MWSRIALVALTLAAPAAVARAQGGGRASLIEPPPGSKLVGSSVVDEIRAFPEMGLKALLRGRPEKAKVVDVDGIDRTFQTDGSFGDAVAYFDQEFKQGGYQTMARIESPSATAWTVKRPDGTIANAVVRNTTPTTFELTELGSTSGDR